MEKFRQLRPNIGQFLKYLKDSLATMKMISIIRNKETIFNDQWATIINILSDIQDDEPAED